MINKINIYSNEMKASYICNHICFVYLKKTWYRSYGHKLSQFVKSKTWKVIVRTLSRSLGSYRTVSYKGPQQHTSVNLFKEESLWSSLYENRETKNIYESHLHTPTIEQQVLDYGQVWTNASIYNISFWFFF